MQHKRLATMVHICDIAVRSMKIGFPGDHLIPEMDPYAKRLQKSVEEITEHQEDFVSQINSILGGARAGKSKSRWPEFPYRLEGLSRCSASLFC